MNCQLRRHRGLRVFHSLLLISYLLFQCGALIGCKQPAAGPASTTLTLLAAASTQNAVGEIAAQFSKETGIQVTISAAGSNTLATQIINGAPADVFLSADQKWADAIKDKGLTIAVRPLLSNDLVLIVPKSNPADVHTPKDLLGNKVAHVAIAGEKVPCGIYGQQALTALGIYATLEKSGKLVRGEDVRGTLNYVERGEADAGIVYSTDALIGKNITTVYTFDPKTYEKVVYPLVLLKSSNPTAAKQLYDFLAGDEAHAIFEKYGFKMISG